MHHYRIYLAMFGTVAAAPFAQASCLPSPDVGFIHADIGRLPANARGALFLLPLKNAIDISPASFTITSDRQPGNLPVSLTWLPTPPGRNLARIAPANGFQPGARYTIALTTEVNRFKYRTRTSFVIDDQPLAPRPARLIIDGEPATRLLATVDAAPDPGLEATAAVDFHYALADAYEPYRKAVMYWSETRTGSAPFVPTGNIKSYCGSISFGATWLGNGRDVVRTSCRDAGASVDIRGQVGLLEVEDQLQETNTEQVAFHHAANESCNGTAALQQALAAGTPQRLEAELCNIYNETAPALPMREADTALVQAILALAGAPRPPTRSCIILAANYVMTLLPAPVPALQAALGDLLREDLESTDPVRVNLALRDAHRIGDAWQRRAQRDAQAIPANGNRATPPPSPHRAILAPAIPALAAVTIAGQSGTGDSAAILLLKAGPYTELVLPALWAAAERDDTTAQGALLALLNLAPKDPRLPPLLDRATRNPVMRQMAALGYNRVAGSANPQRAIVLLTTAAQSGSIAAADELGRYGRQAAGSVPVLLDKLATQRFPKAYVTTLTKVSQGEPEVTAALNDMLNHYMENRYQVPLEALANLGAYGQPLLPALEALLQQPLKQEELRSIGNAIKAMVLPAAQEQQLLAKLPKEAR